MVVSGTARVTLDGLQRILTGTQPPRLVANYAINRHLQECAMSLNVSLPPELENRVRQHVESGLYSSASEVIREALRLFEVYRGVQAANLASLKADIAQGIADIEAGRVRELDLNDIKQRGRATLAARRQA